MTLACIVLHTYQSLVDWGSTHSSYFNVSNGVKQGGVISAILFCIYIDGLLVELVKVVLVVSWGVLILGHLAMLMTSNCWLPLFKHCIFWLIYVLNMLLNMIFCLMEKSLLMIYKCTKNCPPDPAIIINDVTVLMVHEVIHLGHKLSDDIYKFSSTKCVEDFNRQSNIFLANFKYANSNTRNAFFQNYCTFFSQMCNVKCE